MTTIAKIGKMAAAGVAGLAALFSASAMLSPQSAQTAQAATLTQIYRVAGVYDDGGGVGQGVATAFICSNPTATVQTVRVQVRQNDGSKVRDATRSVDPDHTTTFLTHIVASYAYDNALGGDPITQGQAIITATSTQVFCSAVTLDAANATPTFAVALHMVPWPPGRSGAQ